MKIFFSGCLRVGATRVILPQIEKNVSSGKTYVPQLSVWVEVGSLISNIAEKVIQNSTSTNGPSVSMVDDIPNCSVAEMSLRFMHHSSPLRSRGSVNGCPFRGG